jgi:hypothetical protein
LKAAMAPASVITMDRTAAKIGRSMKNRENIDAAANPNDEIQMSKES